MTATYHLTAVDPEPLNAVRATAARIAGRYGFSYADRDDIRQDLLLDFLIRFPKFDPAKSSRRTFLYRVVRHRVATLLDAQRAACRDYRLCRYSLDGPVQLPTNESIRLGETVSADDYEARIGGNALSSCERAELRIDVAAVIASLPSELAAVAVVLKSEGIVEAGRRLELSRSTLHRRLVRIREVFEAAGLGGHLRKRQRERPVSAAPTCDVLKRAGGARSRYGPCELAPQKRTVPMKVGRISSSRKVCAGRPHTAPTFSPACPPMMLPGASRGLTEDNPDA